MPATKPAPKKGATAKAADRKKSVLIIPKENNSVYGPDIPMHWKEAAAQAGIPERTFWRLIDRREIDVLHHPGRVLVKPSAIRAYLAKQEVKAL